MVWSETITLALIAGIPGIIGSLTNLIFVLRGNGKITVLEKTVNGKFSEMLEAVKTSSETKGKVDTIEKIIQPSAPTATIITDRRKE